MSQGVKWRGLLDGPERRQVEAAAGALSRLPASAPIVGVFDAIRSCVPLEAGLFGILRPSAPDAMVMHASGLPPHVFDRWIATPPDQLAATLAPIFGSAVGDTWRDSETVTGALREKLDVLRARDDAGFGEGLGYKALERRSTLFGVEHFMLAMLMPRDAALPPHTRALLAALNPAIAAAVLRLQLPLTAREPLLAQIMEERATGYICLSRSRSLLEANRRAHEMVRRYHGAAGLTGVRGAVAEFGIRAWEQAARGTWALQADDQGSILELSAHVLPRESHHLPEDVLLVMMVEVLLPPSPEEEQLFARAGLTPQERKVARRLAYTAAPRKQIADELPCRQSTLGTHIENIFRKLQIGTRQELTKLLRH